MCFYDATEPESLLQTKKNTKVHYASSEAPEKQRQILLVLFLGSAQSEWFPWSLLLSAHC